MKYCSVLMCALLIQVAMNAAVMEGGVSFPMKYEGGSLAFDQHDKLKTTFSETGISLDQGKNHFTVPMKSITEVSYGNDVHRRVGAAIGLAVVSLGLGAFLLLAKDQEALCRDNLARSSHGRHSRKQGWCGVQGRQRRLPGIHDGD